MRMMRREGRAMHRCKRVPTPPSHTLHSTPRITKANGDDDDESKRKPQIGLKAAATNKAKYNNKQTIYNYTHTHTHKTKSKELVFF